MSIGDPPHHGSRGRVVMLVDNGVDGDSRVLKTARSAADAGWDVTLLGISPTGAEEHRRLGTADVRLLPMGGGTGAGAGLRQRLLARGGLPLRIARLARRPLEHAQVRFWRAVQGDRSWRKLEPGLWNYERAFGSTIDELQPDLIHAHDFRMLGVGARAVRRARAAGRPVKLVWDAHEFLPGARPRRDNARWLPAHLAYEREYVPFADAVVTVSDTLAGMLQREHGLAKRPTVVLNAPGAPVDAEVPDLRALCGVDERTPLLVYSGSASPQRGLSTVVDALSQLDGVHLALVVSDPAAIPATDRVHPVPYVPHDQVAQFLAAADVGVIPIQHWPNHEIALITKFFEYSHAHLPIVVSDVKTMAETVRATGQGVVFRAEDTADFVRAVRTVLRDPEKFRKAYDGPHSPLSGWTWAAQAAKLDALYAELVDTVPDVTVVVPVYNTMPYLTECLDSLVTQSIGRDRLQVIAVDDGSTDGSGAELDRYAQRYPDVVTVLHQANSGGPPGPCNRALEMATGRYVFFVGSDDYLAPEALQRMVGAADDWGSDVLLGKVVGVHSRHIYQDVFARNEPDLDLYDSPLPRSLANTKLFRRELIEQHGIRYREDMRIGSDLPFTLEACYRARRISVLADYACYYAVRRFGATNITYLSRHLLRLQTVEKVMAFVTDLIEPGKQRDAILLRRFDHEVARLLEDDFLRVERGVQQQVHDGIGRMVREHLSDEIAAQLSAEARIRMALARDGSLDDLLAVIRQDARVGVPPTVVKGGRRYAAYPGLGRLPDACFDVTDAPEWPVKLDAVAMAWHDGVLTITARAPGELPALSVSAEEIPAQITASAADVRIAFRAADLLAGSDVTGQRRAVSAQPGAFDPAKALGASSATGAGGAAALRAPALHRAVPLVRRRGTHLYVITPVVDDSGRLMISVVPFTAKRVGARLRRLLKRRPRLRS